MPRYVDHAARRDLVARVAADLAADEGLEAMTVRRVAEAAGFSTTVVSHYFTDRRDLMVTTYRAAAARSSDRFDAALAGSDRPLRSCLEALLPLDEDRRRDWRIWFAFWALATADRQLGAEQLDRVRSARVRITRVLERERDSGRIRSELDLRDVAYRLLVLVHGLGTQAVFDPEYWTPARQRAVVVEHLTTLSP